MSVSNEIRVAFTDLAEVFELIEAAYAFDDAMSSYGAQVLESDHAWQQLGSTYERFHVALHALPRPPERGLIDA